MDDIEKLMLMTIDFENLMDGKWPVPALTTMLMKVCEGDSKKFNEAMRLVRLFVERDRRTR